MKYKPLKYFILYIMFTLFVSFWGPAKYIDYDRFSVFIFMSIFLLVFIFGYFIGIKLKVHNVDYLSNRTIVDKRKSNIIKLIKISIIISTFAIIIELAEVLLHNPTALSISNIGQNYNSIRLFYDANSGYSFSTIIRFFTGFFRVVIMTIGIYNFNSLRKNYKIGLIIFYVLTIFVNSILFGTQKVIGDIIIYFGIIAILKISVVPRRIKRKIYVSMFVLGVLFVSYIVYNQVQRYELIGVDAANYGDRSINGIYFDTDNFVFDLLGDKYGFGFALLISSYMSSGYYGLSLSLQLPFKWTFGLGSSYVVSTTFERLFGFENQYFNTYLHRMEEQFGRLGADAWNTIFPWLASDLTFFGSLLIFIPIAIVYAISWKEVIRYKNPISLIMFSTITLGLVFVPSNNQLFLGIDGFISSWIVIILWILTHNKYNFKMEKIYEDK